MSTSNAADKGLEAEALRRDLKGLQHEAAALVEALANAGEGSSVAAARRHVEAITRLIDEMQARLIGHPPGAAAPDPRKGALAGRRILIVDEAPDLLRRLTSILRAEGAVITAAGSGAEAEGLIAAGPYDLLFTDAWPGGPSGAELIAALRALPDGRAGTPALAMTADLTVQCYDALIAAGATRVVTKPLPDPPELVRIAARLTRVDPPAPAAEAPEELALFDPAPLTRVCALAGPIMAREILDRLMLDLLETLAEMERIGPVLASGASGEDVSSLRATTQVLIALAGTAGAPLLLRKLQTLDYRLQTEGQSAASPDLTALLSDIRMLTRGTVAAIARLSLPMPGEGTGA